MSRTKQSKEPGGDEAGGSRPGGGRRHEPDHRRATPPSSDALHGLPFGAQAEDDPAQLLVRVALDLHDGPLQELAALLADTRLFRARAHEEAPARAAERLEGFLDDVETRLSNLDASLRAQIRGEGASTEQPVEQTLEELRREFAAGTGLRVELHVEGALRDLSSSQGLTLVRAIQAALANVRRHAHARSVDIVVRRLPERVEAEVVDDGVGFDVAEALLRAVREGRLGLAGMAERVRILGGEIEVESGQAGRGTRVAVSLPVEPPRERRR